MGILFPAGGGVDVDFLSVTVVVVKLSQTSGKNNTFSIDDKFRSPPVASWELDFFFVGGIELDVPPEV